MSVSCGTLTVEAPFQAGNVEIVSCNLSTSTLDKGAGTVVTAEVTVQNNNDDRAADVGIIIETMGGITIRSVDAIELVDVPPNGTETYNLTFGGFDTELPAGDHEIVVNFKSVSPASPQGMTVTGADCCGGRGRKPIQRAVKLGPS